MHILRISINVQSNKHRELLSTLRLIINQTRKEKGCLDCRLLQDLDNENLLYVEERWEHLSYMENHFRSDLFSTLRGASEVLGESFEVRIVESSQTLGMELIRAAQTKEDVNVE